MTRRDRTTRRCDAEFIKAGRGLLRGRITKPEMDARGEQLGRQVEAERLIRQREQARRAG